MSQARTMRRLIKPTLGTVKVANATTAALIGAQITSATGAAAEVVVGLGIGKAILDIGQGIAFWKDADDELSSNALDPFGYSPNQRQLLGGLQTASGLFLLEGGIEHICHQVGLETLGFGFGFSVRLAISYSMDCLNACINLGLLYKQSTSEEKSNPGFRARRDALIAEVAIKALYAAGFWAMCSLNPFVMMAGAACLVTAVACTLYKNRDGIVAGVINLFSYIPRKGTSTEPDEIAEAAAEHEHGAAAHSRPTPTSAS